MFQNVPNVPECSKMFQMLQIYVNCLKMLQNDRVGKKCCKILQIVAKCSRMFQNDSNIAKYSKYCILKQIVATIWIFLQNVTK